MSFCKESERRGPISLYMEVGNVSYAQALAEKAAAACSKPYFHITSRKILFLSLLISLAKLGYVAAFLVMMCLIYTVGVKCRVVCFSYYSALQKGIEITNFFFFVLL